MSNVCRNSEQDRLNLALSSADDFLKLVHEEIVWKAIAGAFDEPRAKGGSQLPFGSKVTPCLGVIARVSFPRER